ncbi:MAG TPA: MBL fold metallo-hydrolase [Bacteroidales bacterium]|nr:MBL fold metallo-hydrolase [Bacteroidales bacterium]
MKITFHGAARTVTGSKHLITLDNGKKLLLDCGMFQGMGKETYPLNRELGFDAREVSYMVLSHAHIDHSGLIPLLVKYGFNGKIYGSEATLDLTAILLKDSAHIQEADTKFLNKKRLAEGRDLVEPLYTTEDVDDAVLLFEPLPYDKPFVIDENIEVELFDAGHIIGSATVFLKITENGKLTRIGFSGDVGRYNDPILRSPQTFPQVDYMLIESTYGNRLHDKIEETPEHLRELIVETCIDKRGKLIIPAFSVGRTQELLFALNELELNNRLPNVKYFVDSPLSVAATNVVKKHPECFNRAVQKILKFDNDPFDFRGLHFIEDKRDSQAINDIKDPCVVISASGMAEAGRVKHHIANSIGNPKNTILMVGYCAKNTLGARLKEHPTEVSIFGDVFKVRADIRQIESMSAHADYNDLCQYLSILDPENVKRVFVVHGEPEVQDEFRERIIRKGFRNVVIPEKGESFKL